MAGLSSSLKKIVMRNTDEGAKDGGAMTAGGMKSLFMVMVATALVTARPGMAKTV